MKKTAKRKKDPKELTRDVTTRFMMAMGEIIALNKRNGTGCKNIKQFAASIQANFSNFSLYENPKDGRNVTLEMCCEICRVHNINANWLMVGKGERYYNIEALSKVQKLESMVLDLAERFESLDKDAKKPVKKK
ncbi:MAG: hypothetical protein JWO06_2190 [Bacteroidota bacterium]|nr:hypothetical protein [Bacteroidota bacterium]